jgi:MEMO1 family protein
MDGSFIRKAILAGSWYPGDPSVLRKSIDGYLRQAEDVTVAGEIVGLLAPHAGYVYSGHVAAHAYQAVRGQSYDAVILIAPSHREYFSGVSVYARGAYETPLGMVPVDTDLAGDLIAQSVLVSDLPSVHRAEHAIEIQLPFLQFILGSFRLVPLIMGDQTMSCCRALANAIVGVTGGRRILVVASSDLSHFHSYGQAVQMDRAAIKYIAAMDPLGLLQSLDAGEAEACGGGPSASAMMVAKGLGATGAKVLKYANSGDMTHDRNEVVGYAAAAFYKTSLQNGEPLC